MPNMFTLVKAGLVIPLNTACVERGLSHHGIIKNKLRSRLKVVNVDSLLRVKLLCRDYKKFDYQRAMELRGSMHNSLISSLARKEGRFTHPWQPARLIGWNSVWVGQCDISAMTSCQGKL